MAAARGLPIPAPDEIPPELENKTAPRPTSEDAKEPSSDTKATQNLMVPIKSRSQSYTSDGSQSSTPAQSLPSPTSPITSGSFTSPLFRTRAKTLASLSTPTRNASQADLLPREIQLAPDPFVNGQPIEAYLYKDAGECPICFLYYPPYLNRTRCCDQPICSECFVQIKRPDPHPPEHGEPDPNNPNQAPTSEGNRAESADTQLVTEAAACPFCVQPEFGVTYIPPPFRRGLSYASDPTSRPPANLSSPMSSSTSSLSSGNPATVPGRRRATSLSANDPTVVTTDRIRPDWAQKLANARAHAARRSAAATALHTAAYVVNSNPSEGRNFGLGRRRRASATTESHGHAGRGSPALNALAFLTDRRAPPPAARNAETPEDANIAPARGSSRRTRLDDLEEMMMMEAIRMSLASEDERQKRQEKEVKKEAKRRDKEAKKVEKTVRKSGLPSPEATSSGVARDGRLGGFPSSSSSVIEEEEEEQEGDASAGKGKQVDRASPSTPVDNATTSNAPTSTAGGASIGGSSSDVGSSGDPPELPTNMATDSTKPSHLRQMSSASSSISSLVEPTTDEHRSATTDGNQTTTEPMFNFRSLAAVIGDEEKGEPEHVERTESGGAEGSAAPKSSPPEVSSNPEATNDVEQAPAHETKPEQRECVMPNKELETRSVEITRTSPNPETTL